MTSGGNGREEIEAKLAAFMLTAAKLVDRRREDLPPLAILHRSEIQAWWRKVRRELVWLAEQIGLGPASELAVEQLEEQLREVLPPIVRDAIWPPPAEPPPRDGAGPQTP